MSRLFIVDDDIPTCELLQSAVSPLFSEIKIFNDARLFLTSELTSVDIVLLDLMMPNMDGVEVIRSLAQINCSATLVLMSGYDEGVLHSSDRLAREYGLNVAGHLSKPIAISKLRILMSALMHLSENATLENIEVDNLQPDNSQSDNENQDIVTTNKNELFVPTSYDLQEALSQKQLQLFYQPQIKLESNKLIGVEALVRWFHPIHGLIYPDQFIALAEQNGLIGELTAMVINLAVKQSKKWNEIGLQFNLSLNISPENITSLKLPEQLTELIMENNIDPAMITLEITESALMGELTTATDILTRLRLKGFQLSIDDFGTGYSSLSQLHRIPFTELKIDKSFITTMMDEPESMAIVETCIMLGHKLNMEVVAEGVETEKVYQILKTMGCDIVQGYFIARPMTAEKLINWHKIR